MGFIQSTLFIYNEVDVCALAPAMCGNVLYSRGGFFNTSSVNATCCASGNADILVSLLPSNFSVQDMLLFRLNFISLIFISVSLWLFKETTI